MNITWDKCLSILEKQLKPQDFRTWFKPLKILKEGKLFTICAPNRFFLDWITSRYKELIVDSFNHVLGHNDFIVDFSPLYYELKDTPQTAQDEKETLRRKSIPASVGPQLDMFTKKASFNKAILPNEAQKKNESKQSDLPLEDELYGFDEALALPSSVINPVSFGMHLKHNFTFSTFVEGKSNEVAKAAAIQTALNPGAQYNPLFLYGGSGLGKTHLMHAIGNEVKKHNPKANVLYVSSEKFVKDMVDALRLQAMDNFQNYYRSVDFLLVDDIQFIAGKGRTQEEFFHTFNSLLDNGKQIILSCDRYPKELEGIEDRLRSRFGHGLTVTIDLPDLETRVAILLSKAVQGGVELSHEVAFYIAKYIRANVRELEGALKRVITHSKIVKADINPAFVAETLKDIISIQEKLVKVDNIQRIVADYYKIQVKELLSKTRKREIARPRQIAMALSKELTHHSLPEIGNLFGGRDHTTVLHAIRTIEKLKQTNSDVRDDYQTLSRKLAN